MTSDAGKLFTTTMNLAYFLLSAVAFLFLFVTYSGASLISVPITLLSFTYVLAVICATHCLVRRDFLVGSSIYVLSRTTQKIIRVSALMLPLPALVFSAMFFNCLLTYDGSAAAVERLIQVNHIEIAVFGKSAILDLMPNLTTSSETARLTMTTPLSTPVDYSQYVMRMQNSIKQHWNVTQETEPECIVVQIKILRDGTLADVALVSSTGSAKANQAAIDAIRACAPLEPLPAGSPDNIDIQYDFDLTPQPQQSQNSELTDQF